MILTSTMITEDQANPNNQKLAVYNEFLRKLVIEKNCLLADLNAEMQSALADAAKSQPKPAGENVLTTDGVHMAFAGDVMMAVGVLKGFGLDAAQIAKAQEAWLDVPGTYNASAQNSLTQRQVSVLAKLAAARHLSVDKLIQEEFTKMVMSLLKSGSR
jgi:hypothetical protein